MNNAPEEIIQRLAEANQAYEKNSVLFSSFLCYRKICGRHVKADGRQAGEHRDEEELAVAMGEQHKITILRLKKLFPKLTGVSLKSARSPRMCWILRW